ncbi:GntR family transcriptional regulator [Bradyrhizobium sp. LHD-71]|uniref:GntR family transcriptional regulator n=1 Tax=Bradyrhizobium sp. LHD-71 TaxID=3072141 RepID=UPI00280F6E80|nr:GntR family transcriptional regulator [Bradyrhizobium sp. LHD-71]MDQ8730763.1 GntR family transcriptional regulator [Bradyrhizobium sp. LHD-71]
MSLQTRWAFVARSLAQSFAAGAYPIGSVLPTEIELAEQFDVSRATVRSALRELQEAGMISRRRNAGTRVEAARPINGPQSYNQTLATVEDVVQFGAQTKRHVQEIADEVAGIRLAQYLQCSPGDVWLRVSSIRSSKASSDQPICWTDVYLAFEFADVVRSRIRRLPGLISDLIEEGTGYRASEIRQSIRAVGIPTALAGPLRTKPGSHALEITRRYIGPKDRCFIISRSVHPGDRFSYETRLSRQTADAILDQPSVAAIDNRRKLRTC